MKHKPYSQMTPAERVADRIAKNRAIDARVAEAKAQAAAAEKPPATAPPFTMKSFDEVIKMEPAEFQSEIKKLLTPKRGRKPKFKPAFDEAAEREKAMAVVEKYFDTDIQDADSAYDVLVDNGVHPQIASAFAQDMYPEKNND